MSTKPDLGLLRFLRTRTDEACVLNAGVPNAGALHADPLQDEAPDPDAAGIAILSSLAGAVLRLQSTLVREDGGSVAYHRLAQDPAYIAYREAIAGLAAFDPFTLRTRSERLAFWINLFNSLAIEAVLAFGIKDSIREAPGFFRRAAYRVGGMRFSGEEIEHGVLRGNRGALPRLTPPFAPNDPRRELAVSPPDPRVHFALNCATRSCPAIRFYTAERIDEQLDAAAAAFVQGGGVTIERGHVTLSAIFSMYAGDFGGIDGLASWTDRYLAEPSQRLALRAAFAHGEITFEAYDWTLNTTDR